MLASGVIRSIDEICEKRGDEHAAGDDEGHGDPEGHHKGLRAEG